MWNLFLNCDQVCIFRFSTWSQRLHRLANFHRLSQLGSQSYKDNQRSKFEWEGSFTLNGEVPWCKKLDGYLQALLLTLGLHVSLSHLVVDVKHAETSGNEPNEEEYNFKGNFSLLFNGQHTNCFFTTEFCSKTSTFNRSLQNILEILWWHKLHPIVIRGSFNGWFSLSLPRTSRLLMSPWRGSLSDLCRLSLSHRLLGNLWLWLCQWLCWRLGLCSLRFWSWSLSWHLVVCDLITCEWDWRLCFHVQDVFE